MPRLFGDTILRALDANGDPVSSARLRLFQPGTTTPISAFSDAALTTPLASPIVANSSGVFPQVYITGNAAKVTMTTADDAGLPGSPVDNVPVLFGATGSGVSVRDFGATGDGTTDDTAAFVAAAAAGPVVYVPAGKYRLTDQLVLEGVTFVGDGWDFKPMLVTDADDLMGTWLICDFETATASSLVHLKRGGKLRDLGLYYPNQTATRPDAWVPTTTPWAITSGSYSDLNRTVRQIQSGAERVCILEFTHGIRLTTGGERGVWREVYGNPFTVGLDADANYDVTRFIDFHFWPFGGNAGTWQTNEKKYVLNNGVAFRFGRVDGLLMRGCFEIGYNIACEFYPSNAPGAFAGHATTNFHMNDCYFDNCITALKNSGTYATGWFVSGFINNATMQHYNGLDAGDVITTTRHPTIDIRSGFNEINLTNVNLTGGQGTRPGSHIVITSNVPRGILSLVNSSTTEWDDDDNGDACIVAPASGARVDLSAFKFKAANGVVYSGAKLRNAGNVRDDTSYDFAFTASLEAETPGDWSAVYGVREGRIRVRDGWFDFWLRLVVTPTFTTASGQIKITGLPVSFETMNEFAVAQFSGLSLPSGRTVTSARVSGNELTLLASGDAIALTTDALTSGTQAQVLITGRGRGGGTNAPALGGGTITGPVTLDELLPPYITRWGDAGTGVTDSRAALVSASAASAHIQLAAGTYDVLSDWTLPQANTLHFERGAILRPANGVTITIAGEIDAGTWQIFDLSAGGSVVAAAALCRVEKVYPEWFANLTYSTGASANGTDCAPAIQAALDFGVRSVVCGGAGVVYRHAATLNMTRGNTRLQIGDNVLCLDDGTGELDHIVIGTGSSQVSGCRVVGGIIRRCSDASAATDGAAIRAKLVGVTRIEGVRVFGDDKVFVGIEIDRALITYLDVYIEGCVSHGIQAYGTGTGLNSVTDLYLLNSTRVADCGGDGVHIGDYVQGVFGEGVPVLYRNGGDGIEFAASTSDAKTASVIFPGLNTDNNGGFGVNFSGHASNISIGTLWSSSNTLAAVNIGANAVGGSIGAGTLYPETGVDGVVVAGRDWTFGPFEVGGGRDSIVLAATAEVKFAGTLLRSTGSDGISASSGAKATGFLNMATIGAAAINGTVDGSLWFTVDGQMRAYGLPASASGLPTGAVWVNSGVLTIA